MNRWSTLVAVEDLRASLGRPGLVVVDARAALADRTRARDLYTRAHIPGARFADLETELSEPGKGQGGRHPWPHDAHFSKLLSRLGIAPADQVVVYDGGDGALAAARLWFMLRSFGHPASAVLDGGWAAWTDAGGPVETGAVAPERTHYDGAFAGERLLDAADVQRHLAVGGVLVDARAPERFRGDVEPLDRVAGHVPGAVNRPYAANLEGGRFKPADQLAREFADLLEATDPGDVVVMCGSGVTACHHILAMEHAGLAGAKLFTGSWSGWIEDPARPVAIGD